MKQQLLAAACLLASTCALAQHPNNTAGTLSIGTRNTFSLFNEDQAIGKGIGGQVRIRLGQNLNSEWYFDYINSKNGDLTYRNDYHIGWSLMFYMDGERGDDQLIQPYFLVGHCFDQSAVSEQENKINRVVRLSMATQAGFGTHINFSDWFDCSLSGQYMLHFGKDIAVSGEKGAVLIEKENFTHADGHLLFTISFNYKLMHIWNAR